MQCQEHCCKMESATDLFSSNLYDSLKVIGTEYLNEEMLNPLAVSPVPCAIKARRVLKLFQWHLCSQFVSRQPTGS